MEENNTTPLKSSDISIDFINEIYNDEEVKTLLACYQCGQCTSSCPATELFPRNPHQMVRLTGIGFKNQIIDDRALRYCLTCRTCQEYCPQNVDFIEFIKLARKTLIDQGIEYEETHNGILTTINELQANNPKGFEITSELVPEGYEFSKKGDVAYFFGCIPILDTVFDYLDVNLSEIAQNGVKILNKVLDKPPVLIENIKCCGHDALWKGQFDLFKSLAEHNVREINKLGVKKIITTCAECYRTLKLDYPKYLDNVNFEVIHLSELIAEKIEDGTLKFSDSSYKKVTYHDPCRLGRHMKVYDPPRDVLNSMEENGIIFNEMDRVKENGPCCGVSCFINCNDLTKLMQIDRLSEAKKVADVLTTTCTKCQIHFKCFIHEKKEKESEKIDLEITDLTNIIAEVMGLSEKRVNENKEGVK